MVTPTASPNNGRTGPENLKRILNARAMARAGLQSEVQRYLSCQCRDADKIYGFLVCETDPSHPHTPVVGTCKLSCCPECNRRAARRLINKYDPVIHHVSKEGNPLYRFQLITLTSDISLYAANARKQFANLGNMVPTFLDRLLGRKWRKSGQAYLAVLQFGKNKKLHIHLIFFGLPLDNCQVANAWQALTGYRRTEVQSLETPEDAVRALAYACKLPPLSVSDIPIFLKVMKRQHKVRSGGAFYNHGIKPHRKSPECPRCHEPTTFLSNYEYERWFEEVITSTQVQRPSDPLFNSLLNGNKSTQPGTYPPGFSSLDTSQQPFHDF